MKDHSFILGFLISLIIISCTHSRPNETVSDKVKKDTADNHLLTFDLKEFPEISNVKLSDIGTIDIEYIPLINTSQSSISIIENINFSDDYFLITHISGGYLLSMFRYDGSFVSNVGTVGRGPNEFIAISDVDINSSDQSIYLANSQNNNFLVYNKTGVFLKAIKSPTKKFESGLNQLMKFKITDEGILCYYVNSFGDIENSFVLFDTTGKIIREFPNKYPWKRVKPGVLYSGENLFYKFNNQIYKKEIYCDTIFAFRNNAFEPHIVIDVGSQKVTPDVRTNIRTRSDASAVLSSFINPWNLFEFGDFIYYEMGVIIDGKRDLFSFIGSRKADFKALVLAPEGLVNDIDGGPNIWLKTIKNDSTIVSWIDAIELKKYVTSDTFKNSSPRYPDKKKELEKLAATLQENDNPIIVLIRVK